MSGILVVVLVFFGLAAVLGGVAYFMYQKKLRRAKAIERGLKMVPILIHLPPPSSDTASGSRDLREVMREKTSQAEVLYNLISGTATEGFKSKFYGQRHIALELIVSDGMVHFYAAVPVALVSVVKKAVQTAYPGARMEEAEDHNIFNQEGRLAATLGGEMILRADSGYPIATYEELERDPMEALLTTVSALEKQDGVAIQIMLRPASPKWINRAISLAEKLRKGKHAAGKFGAMDFAKAAVKAPAERREEERAKNGGSPDVSKLELSQVERIEEKTKHPGFEVLVRVLVSTGSVVRSQQLLRDISTTFALFESPGLNGFKFLPALDVQGLVTAFIFRFFPNELSSNVLNSAELATLFHLPDSQFTPSASVERQQTKQVDGPVQLSASGLLFGYNEFRGVKKEIRLSPEDRRRHTYILGQTGTGKSTMLENLAVQDMISGNGFAFIDPHGDSAEKLLALVPKERAEDVIYFNPADTQYPLGLNLFEFNDPTQKDFLVQETINMLYKLYDPGKTGIIGPRFEHWYRNAALTLMSDPGGATFIEIPKVFTDTDYLKQKFKYLKDPTVIDFWTKEMGQTSDYHKSEMLGWFVSKFGALQNNEMMRNIIGQPKSSFNLREVMDQKKILIVNLSKGMVGEINSNLMGMIFVIKFQAAAMSRANVPENERADFSLYVDEFQNFSTDSFASILSEARKYRLNLIVANQFIGQLSDEIREAVFGNIGTIVAHRMGPDDAEFMVKQFAPVFDASDLVNIPNYNAAMRLMIGGLPSQPFSIKDSAPLGAPNAELGLAIKQLSAAKYGREKAMVEAQLLERLTGKGPAPLPPASAVSVATATDTPGAAAAAPAAIPAPAPAAPVAPAPVQPTDITAAPPVPSPVQGPIVPIVPLPAEAPTLAGAAAPQPMGATAPGAPTPIAAQSVATMLPAAAPALTSMPAAQPVTAAPPVAPVAPVSADADPLSALSQTLGAQAGASPLLATTPPRIGAPPVNVPPLPKPDFAAPASVFAAASGSVPTVSGPPPIGAPPVALSAVPASPASATDELAEQLVAAENTQRDRMDTPAPQGAPAAAPSGPIVPPPIGAPPIDLPNAPTESPQSAPMAQSAPDTLSFQDITGNAAPAPVAPAPEPPEAASLSAIPLLGPAAEQFVQATGEPLPGDPYANIDILGEAAPAPAVGAAPMGDDANAAPVLQSEGEPLPNDPYAQIDVLGTDTPAVPVDAALVAPVLPRPVAPPVPPSPPTQSVPLQQPIIPISEPPAEAAPLQEPLPIRSEQPVDITPPEPVLPEEIVQPPVAVPMPAEPDWSNAPEPAHPVTTPSADEPTAASIAPAPAEPLIHFVDPAAEAMLQAPAPAAETPTLDGKPVLSGLPEGVALVDTAPAAPAAVPPVAPVLAPPVIEPTAPVIPPEQAQLAAALSEGNSATAPQPPQPSMPAAPQEPEATISAPAAALDSVVSVAETLPEALQPHEDRQPQEPSATPQGPAPVAATQEPAPAPAPPSAPAPLAPKAPAPSPAPLDEVAPPEQPSTPVMPHPAPIVESAPAAKAPKPPVVLSGVEQIRQAEHTINEVLKAPLIHSDALPNHRRLPESTEGPTPVSSQDEPSAVGMEAGHAVSTGSSDEEHVPMHHGLKVIQPLEPIVPAKERFAAELAQMSAGEVKSDVPAPVQPAPPVTPMPKPVLPKAAPEQPVVPPPVRPPKPVDSAIITEPEVELPPVQSLAAADVAKARATQPETAPSLAPDRPPEQATPAVVKEVSKPQPPHIQAQPASKSSGASRRRRRLRNQPSDKPAEVIASQQEAEHNTPSAAAVEAAPLTGKLILPTGHKPTAESSDAASTKPLKLAPGEVYVDDKGNVTIGE